MSLATRLLGANPGVQVSSALSGSLTTPGAKQAFVDDSNSFESIQTITLGSTAGSVDFYSIPQTYKHLQLRILSAGDANTNVRLRFNNDSGTNYSHHGLQAGTGYGSSVYTNYNTSQTSIMLFDQQGGGATYFNATICDINEYSSTVKNKMTAAQSGIQPNSNNFFLYFQSGLWRSTSAVTQITLYPFTNSFRAGSTFALYGIQG